MGKPQQTRTDTERLRQAANALVTLRGETEKADNDADEDTLRAITGLNKHTFPGPPEAGSWETADALVNQNIRWTQQVQHLKKQLQHISDKLHATTGHYTAAERQEQARMRALGHTPFG